MINSDIGVFHFIILGIILFIIGFIGIISTKNLIKLILSTGIIFNSICINFVAISKYCDETKMEGAVFGVFIAAICFIHLAILISLLINYNKKYSSTDKLKG